MNRNFRLAACMILVLGAMESVRAGIPHSAYGKVQYSNSTKPSVLTFVSYIKTRSGDVLTQSSPGCQYESSTGDWVVQCGNFSSSWTSGDVLRIDFDDGAGYRGSDEVVLTNNSADNAGTTTLVASTVQITLQTDPASLAFSVDGVSYTGSRTFTWEKGSHHSVSVNSPQNREEGMRFAFLSWSDGGAMSHSYTVTNSSQTLTVRFKTQYLLTMNSAHGSPTGAGWYDSGSTAVFSVTTPDEQGGTRYVFVSWSGDGSGSSASGSVVMGCPKTVTAQWKTQYRLVIHSAHGSPEGAGWYDQGVEARFLVHSPDVQGATRYLFSRWSGDVQSSDTDVRITMNGPKEAMALWSTQYFLALCENPDGGGNISPPPPGLWADTGISVAVNAAPASGYGFMGWSGDISGDGASQSLAMDTSKSITANFGILRDIRVQSDPEGLLLTVDGTEFTSPASFQWPAGSSHVLQAGSPQAGQEGIRYAFHRWSDGGGQSHAVEVEGGTTYTTTFNTQFLLRTGSDPEQGGEVTSEPAEEWITSGTAVHLEAVADTLAGYNFSEWSGDLSDSENPVDVIMDAPKHVTACFVAGKYRLYLGTDPPEAGYIEKSPDKTVYDKSDVVVLTVTASRGYEFACWSGDTSGTGHPLYVTMNRNKSITARFARSDKTCPTLVEVCPPPHAVDVPKNTEIRFRIVDPEPGFGVDETTLDVTVNDVAVVLGKADQTSGRVSITSSQSLVTVRYNPDQEFPERSEVTVRVVCRDLAFQANVLDSTYSFDVGVSQVIPTLVMAVGPSGGDVVDGATDIKITVPDQAVNDSMNISLGVVRNPPAMTDSIGGIGLCYYIGPGGFVFQDSVFLRIPCSPSDVRNAGVENPGEVPLCFFSIREGTWKRIRPFDGDENDMVAKVLELGYFMLGKNDGTGFESDTPDQTIPKDCVLRQNYPNPFNAETTIFYELPEDMPVRMDVIDPSGRHVRTLVHGDRTRGSHSVVWDGKNDRGVSLSTGMYLCLLKAGNRIRLSKILLTK